MLESAVAVPPNPRLNAPEGDAHLRSVRQVTGYHVEATDGDAGHIEDFIVEEGTWVIRYVVVDTRNWLPGKKVLLSPWWLKDFDWARRTAMADVSSEDIKSAPGYDPTAPVNREYEEHVYDFYGRPKYWE